MGDGTVSIRLLAPLALAAALLITPTFPASAGGVAIVNSVLTDDGDNDGFADTNETVSMRLTVHTSGSDLTDVRIALIPLETGIVCASQTKSRATSSWSAA